MTLRFVPRITLVSSLLAFGACSTEHRAEPPPKTAVEAPRPSGASYVNGEVLGVDNVPAGQHAEMTLRLQLRPGTDPPVQVHLGPGWYFTERGIRFEPNEPVSVTGTHSHNEAGEEVLIAHELKKGGLTYRRDPEDASGTWTEAPADEAPAPDAADGADSAPAPSPTPEKESP